MKILYCLAGNGCYGVIEDEIKKRAGLYIYAKRVFAIEMVPLQTIGPQGKNAMSYVISTYEDVMMNCVFISNMSEQSPFYQKIMEIVEKEKVGEN